MSLPTLRDQFLAIMHDINAGRLKVTPAELPMEQYCGVLEYTCENGWVIGVFNDCYEWDYVQWARDPGGTTLDFKALYGELDADYKHLPDMEAAEPTEGQADAYWSFDYDTNFTGQLSLDLPRNKS